MEVGPDLCFWSDRSTPVNGAPVLTLSQSINPASELRPCSINGFADIVLELESDTELDNCPKDQWEQGIIKLTSEDLIDSGSTSPIPLNQCEPQVQQPTVELIHPVNSHSKNASSPAATPEATIVSSVQINGSSSTLMDVHCMKPTNNNISYKEQKGTTPKSLPSASTAGKIVESGPVGASKSRNSVIFPNQNSVKCSLCERTFVNCRSRNIHMNKTHSIKSVSAARSCARKTQTTVAKAIMTMTTASATNTTTTASNTLLSSDVTLKSVGSLDLPECSTDRTPSDASNDVKMGEQCNQNKQFDTESHSDHNCLLEAPTANIGPQLPHENQSLQVGDATSKACPLYTVSSPPPGSPSLKIRLVSVKHSKGKKTCSESNGSASQSVSSVSSIDGTSDHTPERINVTYLAVTSNSLTESETTEPAQQTLDSGISCDLHLSADYHSTQSDLGGFEAGTSETEHQPNRFSTTSDKSATFDSSLHPAPTSLRNTEARKGVSKVTQISSSISHHSSSPTSSFPSPSPATCSEQNKKVKSSANQPDTTTNSSPMPVLDTTLRTRDGLYKCRACRRVFANRFSLTGHYKSHYNATQKPHVCEDCGQRYTSASNLHYHRARTCSVLKRKATEANRPSGCDTVSETSAKSDTVKPRSRRTSSRSSQGAKRSNPFVTSKSDDTTTNIAFHAIVPSDDQPSKSIDQREFIPPKPKQIKRTVAPVDHAQSSTSSCSPQENSTGIKSGVEPLKNAQSSDAISEADTKLQRLIEEICNLQEVRDKILSLTSAAILSAIKPLTSGGSHTLLSELMSISRPTDGDSSQSSKSPTAFRSVSSSTDLETSHSSPPTNNTISFNGVAPPGAEEHAQRLSCSDSRAGSVLVTEPTDSQSHVHAVPAPLRPGRQSDQNECTSITEKDHSVALLTKDFSKSSSLNPSIPRTNSRSRVNPASSQPACSRTSNTVFLCENCDRYYSSQSAYRAHFKRFHVGSRTEPGIRGNVIIPDAAQSH